MSDTDPTTAERLRQFRDERTSTVLDRRTEAQQKDADARGTFSAGSRVLDLVTGQEGVVVSKFAAATGAFGQLPVRLDSGAAIWRFRQQLLWRPTPPAV